MYTIRYSNGSEFDYKSTSILKEVLLTDIEQADWFELSQDGKIIIDFEPGFIWLRRKDGDLLQTDYETLEQFLKEL